MSTNCQVDYEHHNDQRENDWPPARVVDNEPTEEKARCQIEHDKFENPSRHHNYARFRHFEKPPT
jgi:hypothetical protein